jgi:type II secretory pathway pseudopilin PulG
MKNQKGISLIETVVAMTMIGLISMGVMNLTQNMATSNKRFQQNIGTGQFEMHLSQLLTDRGICSETFKGINLSNFDEEEGYFINDDPLYHNEEDVDPEDKKPPFTIKRPVDSETGYDDIYAMNAEVAPGIKLSNVKFVKQMSGSEHEKTFELRVYLTKKNKKDGSGRQVGFPLFLKFQLDDEGEITSCGQDETHIKRVACSVFNAKWDEQRQECVKGDGVASGAGDEGTGTRMYDINVTRALLNHSEIKNTVIKNSVIDASNEININLEEDSIQSSKIKNNTIKNEDISSSTKISISKLDLKRECRSFSKVFNHCGGCPSGSRSVISSASICQAGIPTLYTNVCAETKNFCYYTEN